MVKRLLITPGEPAGIGPDIVIQAAREGAKAELVVVADPDLLLARANALRIPLTLIDCHLEEIPAITLPGTLKIIPVSLQTHTRPGVLNPENAAYVIQALTLASELCLNQKADALITGPIQKSVINEAGIPFTGHTEFLRDMAGVKQTVMLFVVDQLKIALLTTHLPLKDVARAITPSLIEASIDILEHDLKTRFSIQTPSILITGLNPHAGEGGYLGREEIDIITPTLNRLRAQGRQLIGPLSADTAFTQKHLADCDAVLAMYHDQALPLVKYLGFGSAVNVTLGLPFIRTSVDHGTALSVAGTGGADAGSLEAAIRCAMMMSSPSL